MPLDSRVGVLVLVLHANRVSELVQSGATAVGGGEIPAVHRRRLVQRNLQHLSADRRG